MTAYGWLRFFGLPIDGTASRRIAARVTKQCAPEPVLFLLAVTWGL
jgi:hypothetical protein